MKSSKWVTLLALLTSLFMLPVQALACACCSDENEYRISLHKATPHELSIIRDIKFGSTAAEMETQASDTAPVPYTVSAALDGNVWKMSFREGTRSGTLSLRMPANMLSYVVDTHDGQKSPGGGPRLYKEWRFEGRAVATGFFRNANSLPTGYFLVFQGWGNRCDAAEDFSHWRLELKGKRTRFEITGELARTSANNFQELKTLLSD